MVATVCPSMMSWTGREYLQGHIVGMQGENLTQTQRIKELPDP